MGGAIPAAHDPSVADYSDTSPFEWGGFLTALPTR
jgi:hypothetical protein